MCDPKSTKTDVTEIVRGENIHECKSKKKQDASRSYEKDKAERKKTTEFSCDRILQAAHVALKV